MLKQAVVVLLALTLILGCSRPSELTKEKAEELAMTKVYELISKGDQPFSTDDIKLYTQSRREEGKWVVLVLVSHTVIETHVYDDGRVTFPTAKLQLRAT